MSSYSNNDDKTSTFGQLTMILEDTQDFDVCDPEFYEKVLSHMNKVIKSIREIQLHDITMELMEHNLQMSALLSASFIISAEKLAHLAHGEHHTSIFYTKKTE